MTLSGYTVTQYRERDKLIDVDLRAPKSERIDPSKLTGRRSRRRTARAARHDRPRARHARIRRDLGTRSSTDRHRAGRRGEAPSIGVTRDIDAALATVRASLPAGYRIEIGGAAEESMKARPRSMRRCRS